MEKKTIRGFSPILSERHEQESVLVVDEDARVVELLQITLSGRGYTVHSAFDGEAAMEEIARHAPDLAVIGVRLPRKSGFQVLEAIRASGAFGRLPVILISGSPSNEARIQGLRLGADDYLVKPFSPRELLIKIRTILDRAADLRLLKTKTEGLEEEARRYREDLRRSHQEVQRYLERIGSLLRHVEEASRLQDLPGILAGLMRACARDLGLERACLLVRSAEDGGFRPRVWHGLEEHALSGFRLGAEGFLCQSLALEGRTMTVDEFARYPSAAQDLLGLAALGLTHLTPVRREDGELTALLAGGDKSAGEPLDRFDLHLLEILARSAGMAIVSAQVFAGARDCFLHTTGRLIATVEARYPEIAGHSERVADLALRLAVRLGLSAEEQQAVGYVARLHDLGCLEQYDHLFGEKRVFSEEERQRLRRLAAEGVRRQLERSPMPQIAAGVCHLQEYWNGSGMPEGIAREAIPLSSRIVVIANAYDALLHPRPHRAAYQPHEALMILRDRAGSQFDPRLVEAFAELIAQPAEVAAAQSLMMPATRGPEARSK